ncbi:MAG: T9SS type A sorting domain-containing protein [Bacteroidetes bacterium]|nr:T9SS type A sorting domain-containing protein [Bacteroidota bacterium]MBL7104486.1 T9SS type A sorting domain-containing protein [Bacteroidales bacterium]
MKTNKIISRIVALIGIMFIYININAQWFYYEPVILPEIPSSNDSIFVINPIEFPFGYEETCPTLVFYSKTIIDSTINLDLFYDISGAWPQVGCISLDTCLLGVLNTGYYSLMISTNTIFYEDTIFHIDSDTLEFNVANSSAIMDFRLISIIKIYPIPTDNLLHIEIPEWINFKTLTLYNLQGKKIAVFNPNLNKLDVSEIDYGLYILDILTNKGNVKKKVLIK